MLLHILTGFLLCLFMSVSFALESYHPTPRTIGKQLFHAAQEMNKEEVRRLLHAHPSGQDFEEAGRYLADNHPTLIGEWLALHPSPEAIGGALFMAARTHDSRLVQKLLHAGPYGYMSSLAGYDIVKHHPQFITQWLDTHPYAQGIGVALACAAEIKNEDLARKFLELGPAPTYLSKVGEVFAMEMPDLIPLWLAQKPSEKGIAAALARAQELSKTDLVDILTRV